MRSWFPSREYVAVCAVIVGVFALEYFLPIGRFPSLLLLAFVVLAGGLVVVPGAWRTLYRKTGISAPAWLLSAGVAGAGISIPYLVGDPRPFCDGLAPYRGCLTAFGWASTVFVGSSLGIAIAVGHAGRYRRIRSASAVPAAEADGGMVSVEGRIVPAGTTRAGPVSDEETVWYRSAVERPTSIGGYLEVAAKTVGDEFYVADGSGRLLVLADRIDEHAAAEFARSHTDDDGAERRSEWSYRPDDPATVVGHASEVSRAAHPEPVVLGLDGPVIVADRTVDDLRFWAARRVVLGGATAVLAGGISLVAMVLAA